VMVQIERFGSLLKDLVVYFDLTSSVLPRVSWEIPFSLYNQRTVEESQPVLDHLVEMGLCAPAKAAAISAWVGGNHMNLPNSGVLLRAVSHCKFLYVPGEALTGKVYLAMGYRDLS